jgi:tetratricopeptide (TPR) repeat protein
VGEAVRGILLLLAASLLAPLPVAPPSLAPSQEPAPDGEFWRWLLERLESPDDAVRENAFQSVVKEGASAVPRLLEGFEGASPRGRLLRARILRRVGDVGTLEAVRARLLDPDPEVRREWAGFLARPDLPRETLPGRVDDLCRLARDPDPAVADAAIEGLRGQERPESARELATLGRSRDPVLRRKASLAIAEMPSGRGHLLGLALWLEKEDPALLALLFPSVGRALGGLESRGELPDPEPALSLFARHWNDADLVLEQRARSGFQAWYEELNDLHLTVRAAARLEWMERAAGEPLPLIELLVHHHVYQTRDEAAALRWIERQRRFAAADPGSEGRDAASGAHLYEGLLHLLAGRATAAEESFRRSLEVLERARRDDPMLAAARASGAALSSESAYAAGGVRLLSLRALNSLLHPGTPGLPSAEEGFRATLDRLQHEAESGALRIPFFDPILLNDASGPYQVLVRLLVPRGRGQAAGEALRRLASILSRIRPSEFLPVGKGDPLPEPEEPSRAPLRPSRLPLLLARFEEDRGDRAEALRILDRLVEIHRKDAPLDPVYLVDVLQTRGGLLMRLRKGEEARESLLAAVRILETLRDRAASVGSLVSEAEAKADLASVYSTLAVNENVVRGDRQASITFRKMALDLDPTDFHRVLYACQLARDGRAEEAREAVSAVSPGPNTLYNLACVHALLGDVETAFEFLRRDFEVKRSGGQSPDADREWAWNDPDLRGLRGDARFVEIVGEAPPSKGP